MTQRRFYGIGLLASGVVVGALLVNAYNPGVIPPETRSPVQNKTLNPPPPQPLSDEFTKHVDALEEELNHYREWAFELENHMTELESRLGVLEQAAAPQVQTVVRDTTRQATSTKSPRRKAVLNVSALVENGIDQQLAEQIVSRNDQLELQQLELRDRTIRDGTYGTEAYVQELRKLRDSAPAQRELIGDEAYDRYLYTLGRSNRIYVVSVIPGSSAEQAGIQNGDFILSYDGKRLFNTSELRDITPEGTRGETIQIGIQRDYYRFSLPLPRGPLGVRMENRKYNPNLN